ncbi:hypothetical protein Hanom_Chr01g00082201 [Helianthus anomalus]
MLITLDFVNPFAVNNISFRWRWYQCPSAIPYKGRIFICHSLTPMRICVGSGEGGGFGGGGRWSGMKG